MDTSRLRKLAGMPVNESSTISHYDHAGDQGKITNIIDNATNALMDNDEEVTPENIMQWIKSRYKLSHAELGHVKDQLDKESDTTPTEQQEKTSKWSMIAGMVHDLEQSGRDIRDIGRKKATDGTVYHEFMIDGQPFAIIDVTNLS